MPRYYHKSTGAEIEAIQYNGLLDDKSVALFVRGLHRVGAFGLIAPGDWIVKDGSTYYRCSDIAFAENYNPFIKEEPMPAQTHVVDPFEPMRQVIDLDSYEYLNEAYPFYIQAIEHALTAGKAPAEIGRFVVENTSSRRDIGLLCEQAARHIQRRRQAA